MQMLISDENLSLLGHFHELSQLTSAEITLLHVFLGCCALYFLFGLGSFVALGIFRVQSAYGRYSNSSGSTFFDKLENGRFVPARTAWVIQECPSFIIPLTMFVHKHSKTSYREFREGTFMRLESLLLFCFLFHYFHRTFIFPLRIRGGKPTPLYIVIMAVRSTCLNGFCMGAYFVYLASYPSHWVSHPRFIVGLVVFFASLAINAHCDSILRSLRKGQNDKGYSIPQGFFFSYISAPNLIAECLEWFGFAMASDFSVCTAIFSINTLFVLIPRALDHHEWYRRKFDDYPKSRKAVIPFVV